MVLERQNHAEKTTTYIPKVMVKGAHGLALFQYVRDGEFKISSQYNLT